MPGVQKAIVLTALIMLLPACDTGGPADIDSEFEPGTFKADISGGITASHTGDAITVSGSEAEDGYTFGVVLSDADEQGAIVISRDSDTRPGTGKYAIGHTDGFGVVYSYTPDEETRGTFAVTSGTLTIDASSNERIEGSFAAEATGFIVSNPEEEVTISISAEFAANNLLD